jgi:hypothetical protein
VVATALAKVFMPCNKRRRASSEKTICFAAIELTPYIKNRNIIQQ